MSWLPRSHHTSINTTWKQTLNMFHLSTNPVINTEKNTTFPFITSSDEVFPTYLTVFDLSGRQKMGRFTCKCGPDADMLPLELRQKKKATFWSHIYGLCCIRWSSHSCKKKHSIGISCLYSASVRAGKCSSTSHGDRHTNSVQIPLQITKGPTQRQALKATFYSASLGLQ